VARTAIEALRQLKQMQKPFFLGVGFWKPHSPFNAPKRYWDLYRREDIPAVTNPSLPQGAPQLASHDAAEGMASSAQDPEAMRELRHGYYAATSYLDAQIGKVIDELDRLDMAENTIVIFWSDHGFHLGEHGLWGKTSNFELDARVPLLVVAPGYGRSMRSASLVELLDLYPTLIDLCGLPAVSGLEGVSLKPILEDARKSVKPAAFTQHTRPSHTNIPGEVMGYSIRTVRYRYTEWRDWHSGNVLGLELYDHVEDADETVNLAGHTPMVLTQRDLAAQLGKQFPRIGLQ
jgi:iduronate 2-sulfatase